MSKRQATESEGKEITDCFPDDVKSLMDKLADLCRHHNVSCLCSIMKLDGEHVYSMTATNFIYDDDLFRHQYVQQVLLGEKNVFNTNDN